jgi:hypothetical protein
MDNRVTLPMRIAQFFLAFLNLILLSHGKYIPPYPPYRLIFSWHFGLGMLHALSHAILIRFSNANPPPNLPKPKITTLATSLMHLPSHHKKKQQMRPHANRNSSHLAHSRQSLVRWLQLALALRGQLPHLLLRLDPARDGIPGHCAPSLSLDRTPLHPPGGGDCQYGLLVRRLDCACRPFGRDRRSRIHPG